MPLAFANALSSFYAGTGNLIVAVPEARTASPTNRPRPLPSPTNVIDIYVDGVAALALVDTNAAVSVISAKLCLLRKVTTPL